MATARPGADGAGDVASAKVCREDDVREVRGLRRRGFSVDSARAGGRRRGRGCGIGLAWPGLLNPENHEGLDFYEDPDEVARVLEHVDRFVAWVTEVRPGWLPEVLAARTAVIGEAASRVARPAALVPLRRSATDPRPVGN